MRWLSPDKALKLNQVLQLQEKIAMLLELGCTLKVFVKKKKSWITVSLQRLLVWLILFFTVNSLNMLLQGSPAMLHTARDKLEAFKRKIQFYQEKF